MAGPNKNNSFRQSFNYAWQGLVTAFKEERNFRFHLLASLVVFILAFLFSFSGPEFLWLGLACFSVISAEMTNTIVENIVDLVMPNYHPQAKKIKDLAAGLALLAAGFAVFIGLFLFTPKLITLVF